AWAAPRPCGPSNTTGIWPLMAFPSAKTCTNPLGTSTPAGGARPAPPTRRDSSIGAPAVTVTGTGVSKVIGVFLSTSNLIGADVAALKLLSPLYAIVKLCLPTCNPVDAG